MITGTLAQVGYRATRIEEQPYDPPPRADLNQAARECTTFLDQCAAEAFAQRWFSLTPIQQRRRSKVREQIIAALGEHGPLGSRALMPLIGHQHSATEKALKELLEKGLVVVVGRSQTMGRPQIYGLPEGGANE
jgi:predicted HTH transcriptional regulator